jgi:hypothetical protein
MASSERVATGKRRKKLARKKNKGSTGSAAGSVPAWHGLPNRLQRQLSPIAKAFSRAFAAMSALAAEEMRRLDTERCENVSH